MSFKENLKEELSFQDIKVKELAFRTGINRRTIDNYLRENTSQPTAENAVKIAQALGVSVEYLVTGVPAQQNDIITKNETREQQFDIKILKKYYKIIQKIDSLPDKMKNPICKMIEEIE